MAPQLLCCLRHITRNRAIRQTNRPVRCRLEPERMLARLGARHHQPSLCRLYLHHLCLGRGVEPAGRHGRAGHVEARERRRRSQLQVHCKVIVFVTFLSFGLLFRGSVFDFQIFFYAELPLPRSDGRRWKARFRCLPCLVALYFILKGLRPALICL